VSVTTLHPFTLGASDVPAVLELDPYLTPYALGVRLLEGDDREQSAAATMGLRLEAAHAELVGDTYDVMPAPADGFSHPELAWLHVHPDALVALDGIAPLELKARGVAPSDATKYRDTVQSFCQMAAMGAARGMVSTIHGGYGGLQRDEWIVDWDDVLWPLIVDRCERFLNTLRRGKLPAPSGSDSDREAIRRRFAHPNEGETIRADQETWAAVLKVRELDETIAAAKTQREKWAQRVQDFMGTATELVSPYDTPAARWRPVHSNRMDTKALRRDHPDLAAEYTAASTTRRFEANP